MEELLLNINGKDHRLLLEKNAKLMDVLREKLFLTGTKCGCSTGDCGACKVIVDGEAVNACLLQVGTLQGKAITTIEGLAQGDRLHPIQQAFIEVGAVQCGFCTPGMVISAKALLDKDPQPTEEAIRKALGNTLCRCTGYVKIVEAIALAAKRMREGGTSHAL